MNPFSWIKGVVTAGRRLAGSLAALADTIDELNQAARKSCGLKGPPGLPAPRKKGEVIAAAANGKE